MEDGRRAHTAIVGWACTTLCLVSCAAAFSHGASLSACADMMPRHLRVQLHSPNSNYVTVHTNMSFYFPGDKVPVTVRSTRDYMGFMLQARKVSNNEIAGTFIFMPPGSKLLTCFEDGDTVTHSDKSLKRNLSFVWKAPDQPIGDIKFFISIVQSYFVYWAKIESAIVAQGGQNKTLAGSSKKPDAAAPGPLQGPDDTHPTGTASKGSPLRTPAPPASPTGIMATPAPEPGFGVGSDARPIAEPKQPARTSRAVSGGRVRSRGRALEPSFPTQEASTVDALQGFLSQNNASSFSTSNGVGSNASAATPRLCLTCTDHRQASTKSEAISKDSLHVTASPSAPHVHTHLGDAAATTAWFGDASTAGNLSLASRQMAERELAPQPEETGTRGEEEKEEEAGGNTLAWVTRPAPKSAVPGKGEDLGRGSRLLAAQLGILLVCTAALGLALAAAVRCVCAQHCHKRTEVSFGEPDPGIAARENGEAVHFRRIRENSFVLVQAEYNWVSPQSRGKKTII
ncbi:reelin domain-containing protein 1 isoform X2 [Pseudopipra pipra]|uniref:reelin domain-containing protein 1 isoform X2 n=1 Tax=Pseudopipra pipra TaxID=415032 RepID=UPI00313869D4